MSSAMSSKMYDLVEAFPDSSENEPGELGISVFMGYCIGFAGILYGYDMGIISGIVAREYWKTVWKTKSNVLASIYAPDTYAESFVIAMLSAGAMAGALFAPAYADWLGRRQGTLLALFIHCGGTVMQLICRGGVFFMTGRFFSGFGMGLVSVLTPIYLAEILPKRRRGGVASFYHFFVAMGFLIGAIVDWAVAHRMDEPSFRISLGLHFLWAAILFVIMFVSPETPQCYVRWRKPFHAQRVLSCLRMLRAGSVREEVVRIKAHLEFEYSFYRRSFRQFNGFRPVFLKRQLSGMAIHMLQQLCGVNFILFYGMQYGDNIDLKNPYIMSIAISLFYFLSSIPGLFLFNKYGRRPLLFWGALGMAICHLFTAICTLSSGRTSNFGEYSSETLARKFAVAFMGLFLFFFASTWGPLPWVITGEIFPLSIRADSLSFVIATHWLCNWAMISLVPYLASDAQSFEEVAANLFFFSMVICLIAMLFVHFFVYETKDRSLEEISLMYMNCPSARKSKDWKCGSIEMKEKSTTTQSLRQGEDDPAASAV